MKKLKFVCFFCIFLIFAAGCAKPPIAEMDSAKEAVTRAENDADAVLYGGSSLARARNALKMMQAEADSKRYEAAKTHASEAIAAADKAIADGKTGAARARDEAASLLSGLGPAIEETGKGINAARSANLALDYPELEQELSGARRDRDQAETALLDSNYQTAMEKGVNARGTISDINQKLTNATMIVSRKK
ncbi:MAG: hypothetical protein LBG91_03690 [Treponema sp.]|nr:hypothetical protein [Treponema sp.]